MNETDLFAVLDRATDDIRPNADPHQAAASALARARVVRVRRRGMLAGAVAAAAVVAVVVATGAGGDDRSQEPVVPVPTTPHGVVHTSWDPHSAGDLPQRDSALPPVIELPSDPGELPLSGPARLAFEDAGGRIHLLESDGRWGWTKPPSGEMYATALSDDGTMLASLGAQGLFVTDVRFGAYEWRQVDLPSGPPFGWAQLGTRIQWQGDTHVALSNLGAGGVATVAVDGGASFSPDLSDDVRVHGYAVRPGGGAVALGVGLDGEGVYELTDGSVTRHVVPPSTQRVTQPVANDTRVVGVVAGAPSSDGSPPEYAGLVVLDRERYAATAYLTLEGTRYTPGITNPVDPGGVTPVQWLDDDTVLLQQGTTFGKRWTLVAWDVTTGELSLVSKGPDTLGLVGVARDLVAD